LCTGTGGCGRGRTSSCRRGSCPDKRGALDRYQYIPFGLGPRVCIGQSFAMQEGVIALAALMRHLRFDYVGSAPPAPVQKITVQPARDILMRISRR